MAQNYALSSSSHTTARNSCCDSAAATKRRLSFRRCSNADRWTSSAELCSDLNKCTNGGTASALLSALVPEKCTNGAVASDSVTSSTATEIHAPAEDGFRGDQLWPEKPKGASRAAVLVLNECSASHCPAVDSGGALTSTEFSGSLAFATAENLRASRVSPCLAELPSPRVQTQAVTGATTASGSPEVATPSSTATASPTRKQNCNSVGALTVSGGDAPKEFRVAPVKHAAPVVDVRFEAELVHDRTSRRARALPREVPLVEDTANNAFHALAKPSEDRNKTSAVSHGGEEQGSDITISCIWSEKLDSASASQGAFPALPADDEVIAPRITAVCLENVKAKAVATEASDAPVVRSIGNAGVTAVDEPLLAPSVEETERSEQNSSGGAEERSGELHGEEYGQTDHSRSTTGGEDQRSENGTSAAARVSTPRGDAIAGNSQQAHCSSNVHQYKIDQPEDTNSEDTAKTTHSTQSSSSNKTVLSAHTHKNGTTDERVGRLSDKLRAKFKREFNRSWVDINSAPSWPPIKKTKYLTSDWKIVDLRVGAAQRHEKKKNRLFLNSLCYLFDGVYTQKSTLGRKAGLGLFCERPEGFRKGQIITEFVGWLVDREQAESYRKQRAASHIVAVQKGFLYIDGAKEPTYGMGGGSFANDGSEFLGGPGNNAHFYHWFDDELGRTRVFIRATADIKSGQEIFVPYERTYWVDNFEEQAENCPELFRKKKLEQLRRKFRHMEELQKSRLAAGGRKRGSCICAPAKQKSQGQKKEDRKVCERNDKSPALKRPLSAYMLFSKERRRELLLQHYRSAETPQQTSSRARRDTDSFATTSPSKSQTTLIQQETEALGKRGKDRLTGLTVKSQDKICTEATCSKSTLEQPVSRPRSRRTTDSSTSVNTTAGGAEGLIASVATADNEEEMEKTKNHPSIQNHTLDVLADAVGFATAGELTNSSTCETKEPAVARTRRRSCRLIESAAARSIYGESAAVDDTLKVRAEIEQEESVTPAKKRRRSGELESVETVMTDCGTVSERKGDRREPTELVVKNVGEGRRRSPRWRQMCCAAHSSAAAVAPDEKIGGSANNHCQSAVKEISAGKPCTPIMRAHEIIGETNQGRYNKARSAGNAEKDCTSVLGKSSSSHLTKSTSGIASSCSTAASCWHKRRHSTMTEQGVESSRAFATDYSAEGTMAARHSSTTRKTPAKPGLKEKVEQKRKNKKTEASGGTGAGEFPEKTSADTTGQDRRNAVLQHFASVIRQVANEWTALPAQERRKWERLAAKEKERYLRLRRKSSRWKSRRLDVEHSLRSRKKQRVSNDTREQVQHAYKKKKKTATTAAVPGAPTTILRKVASRKTARSAGGVVTPAATAIDNPVPAEGAECRGSTETKRSSSRARAHDTATRLRQLISDVEGHSVRAPEGNDEKQTDIRKRAKANTLGVKRCITRAANCAAGGARDGDMPDQTSRSLSKHALEEQRGKAEESSNSQQTGERLRHSEIVAAQQARRGRRRGDTTEAAMTNKQGDADNISRQRQPLFLTYSSVSSVTSCSTTRSSSSRNSSCESRNQRDTDTRGNCQTHENEKTLPVSPSQRSGASEQFDSVCEMLERQKCTTEAEQQGVEQQGSVQLVHDQHKRKRDWQQSEILLDHPGKDQHQQRGRSQQRDAGRNQGSYLRKEGVMLCSREHRSRSTRRRSWSPLCTASVHHALPAASELFSDRKAWGRTMDEMPTDEFLSSSALRNTLTSSAIHSERTKAQGARVGRRRSSGYSTWSSSGKVEQGSGGGSGLVSRRRDRTHVCSMGQQQERYSGLMQERVSHD